MPERLALARTQHLPHHDFLEMLLADELTRRDRQAVDRRAREVNLDPTMVLEAWDDSTAVAFDRALVGRAVVAALCGPGPQLG